MQKRPWQRVLARAGGAFALLAVPAVALAWFTPSAWSALAVSAPVYRAAAAAPVEAAADAAVLTDWNETATLTLHQIKVAARLESVKLNKALHTDRDIVNLLRKQLKADPTNTSLRFKYNLAYQTFRLAAAERNSWEATWFQIGRHGANAAKVQATLQNLQNQYIQANSALKSLQSQEMASGSTSSYTPPSF